MHLNTSQQVLHYTFTLGFQGSSVRRHSQQRMQSGRGCDNPRLAGLLLLDDAEDLRVDLLQRPIWLEQAPLICATRANRRSNWQARYGSDLVKQEAM